MLKRLLPLLLVAGGGGGVVAWVALGSQNEPALPAQFRKLLPLHRELGKPQPGDWLSVHPEPGQTYGRYVRQRPVKPDSRRRVIYVQPLGDFNRTQRRIINLTAEFLGIYFDLPVKIREEMPLKLIPEKARRTHPLWGDKQILTTYVLDELLQPRLPEDACVLIALTTSDLWPGEGWNFVFGQASLQDRVGVWSIYRNGDPTEGDEAFRLCLRRTIKTASHETGHMFSMMHCTLYECNMCGSNHRAESDRRPLALCPHCLAKLCYASGADPEKRFERLIGFCKLGGLKPEQEFYEKSLAAIRSE
jgi:archaemetzincin